LKSIVLFQLCPNSSLLSRAKLKQNFIGISDLEVGSAILEKFQNHGHKDIDSARVYGGGSTEKFLGDLQWQKRGFDVHTKLYPTKSWPAGLITEFYSHEPTDIRRGLLESLKPEGH
jgi:aflatoxin B1 aldehyde reductase